MHKGKTPVSVLQEICQREELNSPEYREIQAEGGSHAPIFITECEVILRNGTSVREKGTGTAKKRAKHDSAMNVLKKIESLGLLSKQKSSTKNDSNMYDKTLETIDFGVIPTNPVVTLEQMLKSIKLCPPEYKTEEKSDKNNESSWHESKCRVEHLTTFGFAHSRKLAKKAAAEKMIKKLEEIPESELREQLNKLSSMAAVMNGPIANRAINKKKDILEVLGNRPDICKLHGRLNENFEDVPEVNADSSTNTFAKKITLLLKTKPDYGKKEEFEKFVKICTDNAIPVRETKSGEKNYFIVVHLKHPLTFHGRIGIDGESLEDIRKAVRRKVFKYFLQVFYDKKELKIS